MSKLNSSKNEWLELVFEGKNKSYGAYELRQDEGKTTIKAFFSALLLLTALSATAMLFSSFGEKPNSGDTNFHGPTVVVDLDPTIKKADPVKEEALKKGKAIKEEVTTDLRENIKIVDPSIADETPITENNQLGLNKDPNATEGGDGNGKANGTENAIFIKDENPLVDINGIFTPNSVEVNPKFPGGINEFLKTVGKKFVAPEIEEARIMRVIVFFIVEKDGSLSNIKVANDPGFGIGAEAIRVLKAIKTKWEPGYMGDYPVRTSFSLPIVVQTTVSE